MPMLPTVCQDEKGNMMFTSSPQDDDEYQIWLHGSMKMDFKNKMRNGQTKKLMHA